MPDPAVSIGKAAQWLAARSGSGGGALPGVVALRLRPGILRALSRDLPGGVALIAGTNGKTTTSRMLAAMLERAGKRLVYNRSGSNLLRGHVAAFLKESDWNGRVQADMALLEVDEAVLPAAIDQTRPRLVILHNLFRDQLDRYGEVDAIARKWSEALRRLPQDALVLANGDDPLLAHAVQQSGHARVQYYGLNDPSVGTPNATSAVDAYVSPVSGQPLRYRTYYLSHLGDYGDPASPFARPPLTAQGTIIKLGSVDTPTRLSVKQGELLLPLTLPLPGLYNVYNALAACAAALALGLDEATIAGALRQFAGAFGRFERVVRGESELVIALIKNPVGASEVSRTIARDPRGFRLLVCANDNFADGLDVSWYWDAAFEELASRPSHATFSGRRAADMALRFKYAAYAGETSLKPDISAAVEEAFARPGRTYVLATYTAMLAVQDALRRVGAKESHWKE